MDSIAVNISTDCNLVIPTPPCDLLLYNTHCIPWCVSILWMTCVLDPWIVILAMDKLSCLLCIQSNLHHRSLQYCQWPSSNLKMFTSSFAAFFPILLLNDFFLKEHCLILDNSLAHTIHPIKMMTAHNIQWSMVNVQSRHGSYLLIWFHLFCGNVFWIWSVNIQWNHTFDGH